MELLATQRGMKVVNEPLLMTRFVGRSTPLPSSWELLLPGPQREPMLERYFSDLIANRLGVGVPMPFSKNHRWFSNRLLFKIQRCSDMMNWFERRFDGKIVYLVRHPIATAISRERYGRLALFLDNEVFCHSFLSDELRAYGRSIVATGTELQKKVLDWCLQNLPPLRFLDRTRWVCLTYEDLVARPEDTVSWLAETLELEQPERILERIGAPSKTTNKSDASTRSLLQGMVDKSDRTYLLAKWRSKVDVDQERDAFKILERFGIDLYRCGCDEPVYDLGRAGSANGEVIRGLS